MVDILLDIDKDQYEPFVVTRENGKRYMYVECLKAIYGTLNAALLFWIKLKDELTAWVFEANPYDWFLMNKMVNGKQGNIL